MAIVSQWAGRRIVTDFWTKTPNEILEVVPDMGDAELRLTLFLIKKTYGRLENGRHLTETRLTYDEIHEGTKLSRGGISNAIDAVHNRGFFLYGRRSMWQVSIDLNSLPSELKSTDETKTAVYSVDQNSLPSRLKSIDYSLPSRLNESPKNKEEEEEKKRKNPPTPQKTLKLKNTAVEPVVFELPPAIDTPQMQQLLADFEKNRLEMKKPLSQRAADLLIKKLADVGEGEAVARLQAAVINNWQGAFYPGDEEKYAHFRNGGNGHANGKHHSTKSNPQPYTPNKPEHAEYLAQVAAYEAAKRAKQPVGTT